MGVGDYADTGGVILGAAVVIVMVLAAVSTGPALRAQGPSPILLEQRQREVVLKRHPRKHVADPGDGIRV